MTVSSALQTEVLIVGTGFSGIAAAIKLKQAGIDDFVLLEREGEVAGTWRDNTYPGCECDVQSHLYSLSFEPNPDWSRAWSGWKEIGSHLRAIAKKHKLYEKTRFNTAMERAVFDEQRGRWRVSTDNGELFEARVLIGGFGGLSNPRVPEIEGLDTFEGKKFHSARWNHDFDFEDKNVAVIGTGASAVQFVPAIAPKVRRLKLFQRTAPWIVPKPNRNYTKLERWAFRYVPGWRRLYRAFLYWSNELYLLAFLNMKSPIRKWGVKRAVDHLETQVRDPELRKKLLPTFELGCKRVLLSNNYYPALARENVDVVTDPIARVTKTGVVTQSGATHEVDAIVLGTGFRVDEPVGQLDIVGIGGKGLREDWGANGLRAYLGTVVAGFPNFFLLGGPNTGIGHTSFLYMMEAQLAYAMDAIRKIRDNKLHSLDVKSSVQETFNVELREKFPGTTWDSGCQSWYMAKSGENFTIWPDFTFKFKARTSAINLREFDVVEGAPAVSTEETETHSDGSVVAAHP